jgi:drug/metabolite transporter (DMT)-like permease
VRATDLAELVALAAIWGASFLFMRLGAADFGPVALTFLRVTLAALALLPLAALQGHGAALRRHWKAIAVVGLVNSALPFLAWAYAALSINAGLSSILNATAPLWAALIAWAWLHERLAPARVLGLLLGFAGVLVLAWDQAGLRPGRASDPRSAAWAVAACLGATLCYGFAANYTRRTLTGVPPIAVAAGSQLAAAAALALPAALWWPAIAPAPVAWGWAVTLGLLCTGLAYLLYFRLIAHVGPARAITVTFLIPAFGVLWGGVFLAERVTPATVGAGLVILVGTALAAGVPVWPRKPVAAH